MEIEERKCESSKKGSEMFVKEKPTNPKLLGIESQDTTKKVLLTSQIHKQASSPIDFIELKAREKEAEMVFAERHSQKGKEPQMQGESSDEPY